MFIIFSRYLNQKNSCDTSFGELFGFLPAVISLIIFSIAFYLYSLITIWWKKLVLSILVAAVPSLVLFGIGFVIGFSKCFVF